MARFLTKIPTARSVEDAFDYMADFTNAARWDPTVVEAVRTSKDEIGEGSTFEVTVSLGVWPVVVPYRLTVYERPHRIVFDGGTPTFRSLDEITFVPLSTGSQLVYDARVELKGPLALADPIWNLLFQWSAARSAAGLAEQLG